MREFASFESRNGRSGLKDQGEGQRRKERGAQKGAGGRGERAKVCWGETGLSCAMVKLDSATRHRRGGGGRGGRQGVPNALRLDSLGELKLCLDPKTKLTNRPQLSKNSPKGNYYTYFGGFRYTFSKRGRRNHRKSKVAVAVDLSYSVNSFQGVVQGIWGVRFRVRVQGW